MKRIVRNVLISERDPVTPDWRDWTYIYTIGFREAYKGVCAILVRSGTMSVYGAAKLPVPVFVTGGRVIVSSDANVVASGGAIIVLEGNGETVVKASGDATVEASVDCTVSATDDARVYSKHQSDKTLIDVCGSAHVSVDAGSTPHVNLRDTAVAWVQVIPFHAQKQGHYGYFCVMENAKLHWLNRAYSTTQPEIRSGWVKEG